MIQGCNFGEGSSAVAAITRERPKHITNCVIGAIVVHTRSSLEVVSSIQIPISVDVFGIEICQC